MKCVLLLPALALLASACVENDLSLTLNRYVAPAEESCDVSSSSIFIRSRGVLDVGVVAALGTSGYIAFPEIQNNLPTSGGATGTIDVNAITVTGLDVELVPSTALEAALSSDLRKFHIDSADGRLTPGSSVVVSAEVLPRQIVDAIAPSVSSTVATFPSVTARVKPIGIRSGDVVIGAAVGLPIDLCRFCLTGTFAACPLPASTSTSTSCLVQQDTGSNCCTQGGTLLCGDKAPRSM